ncbi:MAG: bacterial Ig-like domain-containing protein, partial [Clostridia bacterium]|nr:bacterial Ig-like domain-containing protein [Clostridia bacterium]
DFDFSFAITVQALPSSTAFVSPAQTTYYAGDAINLTGASVTVGGTKYDITADMLDAASYDMATAGNYTVTGTCHGVEFSFAITVQALPSTTAFVSPAKKVYSIGERVLNLTGSTITIDGTTVDVTMDMLNQSTLPNFNAVGDYTVTGNYQGYDFSFAIKVYSPYEFKHDTDFVFTRAADVSKHVWMREVYPDGTTSEWYNVTNDDFAVFELSTDKLHVELDMYVNNVAYNYAADFPFIEITGISVSEFKNLPVGDTSYVYGIVVAIATTSTRNEVILADKVTGEVISVSDLAVSGATQAMTLDIDVEIGDEIVIPATLTQAESTYTADGKNWNTSDLGKLYGLYTGGKQLSTAVLSKGNTAPINYSNATEIDSQADLQNFLSATNRAANVYTMVHFKGEMGFVWYSKASQLRMYFAGGGINSYETQKIDNISPVFCEGTQYYTTDKTFREMMLSANYATTSYSTNPGKFVDIYALFIGGNGYYHKFVILKAEDVKPMEATITNQTFTAPTVTNYAIGGSLNLTGAKVTTSYDIKDTEVVDVTIDMLDASTIPT